MDKVFWVRILASRKQGTMYVGLTSELIKRIWQHRNGELPGFTRRHDIRRLVGFEEYPTFQPAYEREKKLKRWRREWKYALIEQMNPDWIDLYPHLIR